MLEQNPSRKVHVLAVWEPILPTDWRAPTTPALGRLADSRVRQVWDTDHVIARRMAQDARPLQPEQNCCERDGVLWDLAAVYPPGVRWDDRLPQAVIFDGPVVQVTDDIQGALAKLAR